MGVRGRKPGPSKSRVTLYLLDSTIEKLTDKSEARDETLSAYLARNIEASVEQP